MSYTAFPSTTFAAAPGVNDDTTKGYVIGSQWTDTSVSPRRIYLCTDASAGAAVWINAGGVSAHPSLTSLGWAASGHTGSVTSVAAFAGVLDRTVGAVTSGVTTTAPSLAGVCPASFFAEAPSAVEPASPAGPPARSSPPQLAANMTRGRAAAVAKREK